MISNCVNVVFHCSLGFLFFVDCNMTCSFKTNKQKIKNDSIFPFHLHVIQQKNKTVTEKQMENNAGAYILLMGQRN